MFGLSGISPGSILLIGFLAVMFFGTRRLRDIGQDLGEAVKNFKKACSDSEHPEKKTVDRE